VCILQDDLSAEQAEEIEAAWIAQCSDNLVNWVKMGRAFDFQALDRYNKLRDANRSLIQQAKACEKRDLLQAVKLYVQAIQAIPTYASINYEKGLVGKLLSEEADDLGRNGEIEALDRLTMSLIKLKRPAEASEHAKNYFAMYRRDLQMAASHRIAKRIEKALVRTRRPTVTG
jgi:ATP phosphoribosyltransferase